MSCAESAPTPAPAPVVVPPVGAAEAEKKDMKLSAMEPGEEAGAVALKG